MISSHLVEDVRRAEESAAARDGWDTLMQRAARGLADELLTLIPADEVPVVLVGPGNNGGDALFAAAHLVDAGREVDVCLLDPDAAHAAGLAAAAVAGARVIPAPTTHRWVVDAMFGIGARPGLSGIAAEWARWARESDAEVVAVDLPSGIDVDHGTLPGVAFEARHTVTFGTHKVGGLLAPAGLLAGTTTLVDIGLQEHLGSAAVEALEFRDGHRYAPVLTPAVTAHKYRRGVLGVLAGSPRFPGAAHLCVAGALAGPLSMIRFLGDAAIADRVVDRAPEVVADPGRVQACVVGSGGSDEPGPVQQALAESVPLVIDATGLTHLPEVFETDALLTPHAGELAIMLGVSRDDVEAEPWRHARQAAEQWRATVLLKGPRTLVVTPDGRTRVNLSGTPWLSTAGTGDVLAGFAGSLLAAGLDAFEAGSLAAFLHGVAAERTNPGGPITASQVATELPRTLADFLSGAPR